MTEETTSVDFEVFIGELRQCVSMILSELPRYRVFQNLPIPLLEIREMSGCWGISESKDGVHVIVLNKALLLHHSWDAVEEVLRHELAHFLCDYLHPELDEAAHGPMFKKMCRVIGANPHASGTFPLLDELMAKEGTEEVDGVSPVLRKIRKLLALSESPNEHEAHLALMKARELMAKHDIETVDSEDDQDPFVAMKVKESYVQMPLEENSLVCLLQDFYEIRCIIVPVDCTMAHANDGKKRRTYALCGRRSRVKVALYVRDYIRRYVEENWRQAVAIGACPPGVRNRRDYAWGVLRGIRQTLQAQRLEVQQQALVLQNRQLDAYFRARYPHFRSGGSHRTMTNEAAMAAGEVAGRKMKLHDGVEPPTGPKLLG